MMFSSCVDDILRQLCLLHVNDGLDSVLKIQAKNLVLELKFVRTYLMYMEWTIYAISAPNELIPRIEDAFLKIMWKFLFACDDALMESSVAASFDAGKFNSLVSPVLETANRFKTEIREAYRILLNQSWQSVHPLSRSFVLEFNDCVRDCLKDLVNSKRLIVSMNEKIEVLSEKLLFLELFVREDNVWANTKRFIFSFYAHFLAKSAACLSYMCWVDEMDNDIMGGEMEIKLSELLQKCRPNIPLVMDLYVGVLKHTENTDLIVNFVDLLLETNRVGCKNNQIDTIREDLIFLMTFLSTISYVRRKDLKQILADIKAVGMEACSFCSKFHFKELKEDEIQEMNLEHFRLLEKMLLMKIDTVLLKLKDLFVVRKSQLKDSNNDLMARLKDRVMALHQELNFLRSFLVVPPENNNEEGKLLIEQAKELANEAISLVYPSQVSKMTEEMVRKMKLSLLFLVEKIKIVKLEACLMDVKSGNSSLMISLKDQIESLDKGLRLLRTFLEHIIDPNDNIEDYKLFLKHHETVITKSSSLIFSFCVDDRTKKMIGELNLAFFKLLEKIRFIKAEFFLLELMNSEFSWIVNMKDGIESLKDGVRLLGSFLMDPPVDFKEDGKLTFTRIKAVANEAAFMIFLFYDNVMKEDMSKEMNLFPSDLLEKVTFLKADIKQIYFRVPQEFHRTDGLCFLTPFLGYLRDMLNRKANLFAPVKHDFEMLHGELEFLMAFLVKIAEKHNEHEKMNDLWKSITHVSKAAEYASDLFVIGHGDVSHRILWLSSVIEDVKLVKERVVEINDDESFYKEIQSVPLAVSQYRSQADFPSHDEVVIGFNNEIEKIRDLLTRGTMSRDIISIVGMPGLGKTTLAKKVYYNPSVTSHFHIRAWCRVSQVYRRRELLLDILSHIIELTDKILEKDDDDDIAKLLYQSLKKRRYLIVMDDMWNIGAWNDLRESFPDDDNGSRVLFTSRLRDVALEAKPNCKPFLLDPLSDDQSWELLQKKVFNGEECCPPTLSEVGKGIAKDCKGLPLSVVVIAGILARTEKTTDSWIQISESLRSHIVSDPEIGCIRILDFSYKHLPDHLKKCFLYFGALPEDKEISVCRLLWLWIAEGFIAKTDCDSLEDAAEHFLLDLIRRNLVLVAKTRSNGRVKSCHLHDLLRELCLRKAEEENFLELIEGYDERFINCPDGLDYISNPNTKAPAIQQCHMSICCKRERFFSSLMFLAHNYMQPNSPYDGSFMSRNFRFLKALDVEKISLPDPFPTGLELLIQLRYLAVRGNVKCVPSWIANLWNLETFLVKGLRGEVEVPDTIWKMESLRHMHVNPRVAFSFEDNEDDESSSLSNMDTLSTPVLSHGEDAEKMMRRLLRLRKLRCIFLESWNNSKQCNRFPVLDFLTQLETLKIFYYGKMYHPCEFSLPSNLKKLTLSKFRLPWSEMSPIGKLPNLEVLKLLFKAFEGERWEMREGEFLNLKYLKLDNLNIAEWSASSDDLPCLKQLVLQRCKQLEEVPSSFGDIYTLQKIEVHWCSQSAAVSAKQIQEEQLDMGNKLEVVISGMDT